MTWFKVDDGWWSHPKTLQLPAGAIALWARAGSWSCQQLTDGYVPATALPMIGGTRRLADALVDVGYWHAEPGGWRFHDWDEYQESAQTVKARRSRNRDRMRRARTANAADEDATTSVPPERDELENVRRNIFEGLGISDPDSIRRAIANATQRSVPDTMLTRLVLSIIDRASGPVKDPQRYVLAAVRESWAELQKAIDEAAA